MLSLADLPAGTCTLTELETGKETVFSVNAETLGLPEEPTDFFCSLETPGIAMLQVTCPGQTYRFVYDPDQGGFVPFTLDGSPTTPTALWCRLVPGRICWCCTSATRRSGRRTRTWPRRKRRR